MVHAGRLRGSSYWSAVPIRSTLTRAFECDATAVGAAPMDDEERREDRRPMAIQTPKVATCPTDMNTFVLCCMWCGRCGEHLHQGCGRNGGFAGMAGPQLAKCVSDRKAGVLCCGVCGRCGEHVHQECAKGGQFSGMRDPVVARCSADHEEGVLCCSACGCCGNHLHTSC
jgi:hypothetical protein